VYSRFAFFLPEDGNIYIDHTSWIKYSHST